VEEGRGLVWVVVLVGFGMWCPGSGGKWGSLEMNKEWEVLGIEPVAG